MKRQYRITSDCIVPTNFGYSYLVIANPSGSGRRIILRGLEATINSAISSTTAAQPKALLLKGTKSTPLDGEDAARFMQKADSAASLASGIVVRRHTEGVNDSSTYPPVYGFSLFRGGGSVANMNRPLFGAGLNFARLGSGIFKNKRSDVEPVSLNQNEFVALSLVFDAAAGLCNSPLRYDVQISVDNKVYKWTFNAGQYPGRAIFSIENRSTSVVKIVSIQYSDAGTTDTPTIRVVPVGQLKVEDYNDLSKQLYDVIPLDSSYGTLNTSHCKLLADVGFVPFGVPESAIAQSSTGTPKGLNYLHTKDFTGPLYRIMLAEVEANCYPTAGRPSSLGFFMSQRWSDLLVRRSPGGIVINQGEAIALVNSAETATSAVAANGFWPVMAFSATVDILPATDPQIQLTGLLSQSDVVLLTAGTETVITDADAVSGTWSYSYDPDVVSAVDVCVYRKGSLPYIVRNLSLGLSGAVIPVAQAADRSYNNP